MPTGDVLKATVEGTCGGEPVVIGFGLVSASGLATFQEEADELAARLTSVLSLNAPTGGFLAPLSAQYKLSGVRIQDLNPGVAAGRVYPVGGVGGNSTDDAMPPLCALCVTWRTDLKGKENRGRTYLSGFAEDSANAGYWIPEIQDWAVAEFAGQLMGAFGPLGTENYSLSLIHTMSGGSRIIPPTATPITGYTVNNTVRGIRRRGVGVRISRHRSTP
jgi:hypothetical protein